MNKKDYLNLISTYIRISLGFIGITSSLLIPILITFYFRYFNVTSEIETLTIEQTNYINQNLTFLTYSIFIFLFSLLISLIAFSIHTISDKRINQKGIKIFITGVISIIIIGITFLIASILFLLLFFIPNKLFIAVCAFIVVLIMIIIFIASYLSFNT